MTAILGLCAALGWGLTDFLAGPTARRAGIGSTMLFTSLAGLAALVIWISARSEATIGRVLHATADLSFCWTLVAGLLSALASLLLTCGLADGKSAIVAPIAMSYGAVATTLSLIAGEVFRPAALAGLVMCVIGAPLTALDRHHEGPHGGPVRTGVLFATGAAFCYGTGFWMQGRFSVPQLGTAGALLINYMCGVLVALVVFVRGQNRGRALLGSPRVFAQAAASITALACLAAGTGGSNTAVVTVLSSLSGGVAALLARVFRKEQLSGVQVLGVVGSTVGATVLSM